MLLVEGPGKTWSWWPCAQPQMYVTKPQIPDLGRLQGSKELYMSHRPNSAMKCSLVPSLAGSGANHLEETSAKLVKVWYGVVLGILMCLGYCDFKSAQNLPSHLNSQLNKSSKFPMALAILCPNCTGTVLKVYWSRMARLLCKILGGLR